MMLARRFPLTALYLHATDFLRLASEGVIGYVVAVSNEISSGIAKYSTEAWRYDIEWYARRWGLL